MPGFVDPRPHQEAERRAKQAELDAATDEVERARLKSELDALNHRSARGGFLRRLVFGFSHRSVPW
jgi:hypothetical protein